MKKLILAATLFLVSTSASAGLWEKVTTLGQETKQNTAAYTVEAAGWNIRVVEWIPAGNPDVRCMFGGGSKKGGIACYSVKK